MHYTTYFTSSIYLYKPTTITLAWMSSSWKASGNGCFSFTTTSQASRPISQSSAPLAQDPSNADHRSCSGLSMPLSLSAIRLDPRPILEKDPATADDSPLKLLLPPSLRL